MDSLGVRLISRHSAWDFGLIGLPSERIGALLPWVYNF